MTKYIGSKIVKARPMSRQEYNDYRGWELPDDEDGNDRGFLVEYVDGGKANHPNHEGYVSWSPGEVFAREYKLAETWRDRVLIEADDLSKKISDLEAFRKSAAYAGLDKKTQALLESQVDAMYAYLYILKSRLDR